MATTYEAIATVTASGGSVSSLDFNSIPSTYTDLCLMISARSAGSGIDDLRLKINGVTTNRSERYVLGNGATTSSGTGTSAQIGLIPSTSQTASTFGNTSVYIPNYAGSNNKSFSVDDVTENNATTAYASMWAALWSQTTAISSLSVYGASANLAQYSTATLYGIKNS
jgi:hypothetical protein